MARIGQPGALRIVVALYIISVFRAPGLRKPFDVARIDGSGALDACSEHRARPRLPLDGEPEMTSLPARFFAMLPYAAAAALLMLAPTVSAGPIALNTWLEFAVSDPGVDATGCDPDDPNGPFCIPSSGTPTQFLDAPPWTFSAPA